MIRHSARPSVLLMLLACAVALTPLRGAAQAGSGATPLAIVGADVLTMDGRGVLSRQTVLVRDGRIEGMGPTDSVAVDTAAYRVIDAAGRVVMPGLVDAHVHLREAGEDGLLRYLRAGVTTVRDMNGRPWVLAWRDRIRRADLRGPTLYVASPTLGNFSSPREGYPTPQTEAEGRTAVRTFHRAGYDWIKVYSFLPAPAFRGILEEAESLGMPVGGHVPLGAGRDAFSSGLRSIEHLTEYAGLSLEPAEREADERDLRTIFHAGALDAPALDALVESTVRHGIWNVPTIVWFDRNLPSSRALPAWRRWELRAQGRHNRRLIVGRLHRAGAWLAVGTDSDPLGEHLYPSAILDELEAMTEAGMTPMEVLHAATAGGARLLGALDDFGTVTVGKRADLLVLLCSPHLDLLCLADIEWVVARGRLPVWEADRQRQREPRPGS